MSNVVLKQDAAELRPQDLAVLAQPVAPVPAEANDNPPSEARQQPEPRTFELPPAVWALMVACYALFLLALLGATGGAHAALAIAVSATYVAMFFGTARVIMRQAQPQPSSPIQRADSVLNTAYGPLARGEVYCQVLIVPAAVAFFGAAIALIVAFV